MEQIWESANNISVCNRTSETQFRLLHRLQITHQFRHKLDNNKSELCAKCSVEVGSFIHCVWTCRYIDRYWNDVVNRICLIFNIKPKKDPLCLLFGLPETQGHTSRDSFLLSLSARERMYCLTG